MSKELDKLKTRLETTRAAIKTEEENMVSLAKEFMDTSERHENLMNTQRSLKAMIYNCERDLKK